MKKEKEYVVQDGDIMESVQRLENKIVHKAEKYLFSPLLFIKEEK